MELVVYIGIALTLLGVAGLIWCIVMTLQAKRSGGNEDEIRARLQRVVLWNLGALGVSALGLGCVVFGLILS